jgi:hypothetical protein
VGETASWGRRSENRHSNGWNRSSKPELITETQGSGTFS